MLADQLAQARLQFDHFQQTAAEQRQQERQLFDARVAAIERELGSMRSDLQQHRKAPAVVRGEQAHLEVKAAVLAETSKAQVRQLNEITDALGAARDGQE